jgi:hypothetical protein
LARKAPNIKVEEILLIKFLKPLIPGIPVTADVSEMKSGLLQVTLHQNELVIVMGQLRIALDETK